MPNHVETELTITGNQKSLNAFEKKHLIPRHNDTDGDYIEFDFNTIVPMPEELKDTRSPAPQTLKDAEQVFCMDGNEEDKLRIKEKQIAQFHNKDQYIKRFGANNWYDWSIKHWGTKWGAYSANYSKEKGLIHISYQTAWSPATPVLEKLHEMYPNLVFEQQVLDEGMGFGGTQTWDKEGYSEVFYEGTDLMNFCNEYFGYNYSECPDCGEMYCQDWIDDDMNKDLCEECNQK